MVLVCLVGMLDVVPIPFEVKSRNSVRTFHKDRNIIQNWMERDEDDVKCHDHDGGSNILFAQFSSTEERPMSSITQTLYSRPA